jgi:hypothetical protein
MWLALGKFWNTFTWCTLNLLHSVCVCLLSGFLGPVWQSSLVGFSGEAKIWAKQNKPRVLGVWLLHLSIDKLYMQYCPDHIFDPGLC